MKLMLGPLQEQVRARARELAASGAAARVWNRDSAFWGGDEARRSSVSNRLGWLGVAAEMRQHLDEITGFAATVRDEGFRDAVLLGMGGSSLAPEVLRQTIRPEPGYPSLHVLDTTDPATITSVGDALDLERTLFFVSSKSGTTIEALSLFAHFHALVEERKPGRAGENFVAITDAGTPLQDVASRHGFRRVFTNPGDIGGRYSALSYFGLVPAATSGVDVAKLLDRADAAMEAAAASGSDALMLGVALGEAAQSGRDKCTFVMSPRVASFGLWVEQLIAESTGKLGRGIVPVAGEPPGTPRQYGSDRLFVQMRLEAGNTGAGDATLGALVAEGFAAVVIDLADEYDLGREFFRWQFAVAVAGHILGINPFDEPNVQESKDNTNRVLREFASSGTLDDIRFDRDDAPVAALGGAKDSTVALDDALAAILSPAAPPDYFAITAYIRQTSHTEAVFADIRSAVRDARRMATTLGYGPRFLHSTGQLHKGGPPRGVFLQVTAADSDDVPIPGKSFTFGQLKRAQAIGDFQSLVSHGRPVVRVHLGRDIDAGLETLREAVRGVVSARVAER